MLLADLDLTALPSEVISNLILSLQDELKRRKALESVQQFLQTPFRPAVHIAYLQKQFDLRTYEEEIEYLTTLYSSALYGLSQATRNDKISKRLRYLPMLLAQDWSCLFPHADTSTPKYYVYAHIDPRKSMTLLTILNVALKGQPFYIGKGSGSRAWDLKRNQGHGKRLQRLSTLGYTATHIVSVIADNLTEQAALILEAKLIYFFGSIYDEGTHGCLLNLADHTRPSFLHSMRFPHRDDYHLKLRKEAERLRLSEKQSMSQ